MTQYAIICIDKPGSADIRLANRAAHLECLKALGERLVLAGPLLSEDGEAMQGSLLVIDFDDRAGVDSFLASEPYALAGLFESVTVRRYKKVLPA
ncbi:MAG: YciI family protein [Magnetospirillum sp.]|nr:YciI family protein [Magnetospirillum sp.]